MNAVSDAFGGLRITSTASATDTVVLRSQAAARAASIPAVAETFARMDGAARACAGQACTMQLGAGLEPPRLTASLASCGLGTGRSIEVRDRQRPHQRLRVEREFMGNKLTPRRVEHYNRVLAGLSDEEIETLVEPWTQAEARVDVATQTLDSLRPAAAKWLEGTHAGEVLPAAHAVMSEDNREAQRQSGDFLVDFNGKAFVRGFVAGARTLATTSYRWLSPFARFAGVAMAGVDLISLVRAPSRSQAALRAARLAGGIGSMFFWPLVAVPIVMDYVTERPRSTANTPVAQDAKSSLERAVQGVQVAKKQTAANIVERVLPTGAQGLNDGAIPAGAK